MNNNSSEIMVRFVCGVCGESRNLVGSELPTNWRIPKAYRSSNIGEPEKHTIVAICSNKCEKKATDDLLVQN